MSELWSPWSLDIGFGHSDLVFKRAKECKRAILGVEKDIKRFFPAWQLLRKTDVQNVYLLCADIRDVLGELESGSLMEIFLLYPDPDPGKRFIDLNFIEELSRVASPGCSFYFATDATRLFSLSMAMILNIGWSPAPWDFPVPVPRDMITGTPCEERYGARHHLKAVRH